MKVAEDSMDKFVDVKEKYSKEKRMMETEVKGVTKKLQTAGVHHKSLIAANGQLEEKERVIEQQEQEIVELKQSLDYLESLMENERLNLFDKYTMSYTPETQMCIYGLLDLDVAMEHVPKVISKVATLCGKTDIDRLPAESTVRAMNSSRLALSHMQLAEVLPAKEDVTLSDETPDRGMTVEGFNIADEEGTLYVLGLREMANKKGQTTLNTFKQILSDINSADALRKGIEESDVGHQVLSHISATLSDQAATQKKFNELLQDYKDQVMPMVCDKWEELDESEQLLCSKISNFFCGLHLLINFAKNANTVLLKYEETVQLPSSGFGREWCCQACPYYCESIR